MFESVAAGLRFDRRYLRTSLRRATEALTRERTGVAELIRTPAMRAVLGSRLVVWAAGLTALAIFGPSATSVAAFDPFGASAPFHSAAANFALAPAARWDSVWYLQIGHAGYVSPQSSAMFPVYPLLLRIGSIVFYSELVVGLAISVAAFAAALSLLNRLISADFGEQVARTTVHLVAFFPVACFFSAVYTESLYLALSVGALYAARRDRWAVAGMLGGLAAATRSAGVLLVLPLVLMYLYGPRTAPVTAVRERWWSARYRVTPSLAWLTLIPAGLAAYLAYLGIKHGHPLAPFHAEQEWGRSFAGPFSAVFHTLAALPGDVRQLVTGTGIPLGSGDPLSWGDHNLIDLGFVLFAVVGLLGAWRRLPPAYLAYGLVLLAQAMSFPTADEPLVSVSRYILVIFPVFLGWALLLERRPRLRVTVLGVSAGLLALFSGLWAMWAWVA